MNVIIGDQPLKAEEKELVEEIYTRLEIFEEANRPYHEEAKQMREVVRLRDPGQDTPKTPKDKRTLQLHSLKSTINNCVADQMLNMPEAKLLPERADQQEIVEDLQDLIHYNVYEVNNYERIHRLRAEDFYGPGTVVTQVAWDPDLCYGKGDVAIIRWPVEAFLWDPQASDIQDARAAIKVSWHPLSWYKAHYPEAAPYVNGEEGQHNNVGMSDSQQLNRQSADEDRAMMLEYWYRTYDAASRRYKINVAYCAGGALLEHKEDVYMHGMYPFVIDTHDNVEGSLAGDGMASELTPLQRYINRYAKYIDTNLRMSSKARMLVRKNSGIDREAIADWEQDIIEGDSVTQGEDWNWMQHAPFNGMISNQLLQFQSDMKQDSGANQFTRGETTGGIVSGKAIAALQSAGGKVQQMRTFDLNNGFKQIVTQILWLMAEFYDDKRVVMVTGRDNGKMRPVTVDLLKFFGINRGKKVVTPPPYTVQVEIVSRDPIRVDAMNEMYMQAYTMAAQAQQYFPLSALFRLMNIEGKDRLLPIIEESERQQQQLMQLAQQNQQMADQLAQMQQENDALKSSSTQMANALANTGGFGADQTKVAEAGGGPGSNMALASRMQMLNAMPEMAD